jgi:hypothetical protein
VSQQFRLIVHCDEAATSQCAGFAEYASTDRIGLARQSDRFGSEAGWLRGYGAKNTYDVCPACRPTVERRQAQGAPVPAEVAGPVGRTDG